MTSFNGLGLHMGNLSRLSDAQSRSISPENFSGEKGRGGMATEGTGAGPARDLGRGWKVSPSIRIGDGETAILADIQGQGGAIQQIWMTPTGDWTRAVLRIYWDGSESPSVESPLGDFFTCGLGTFWQVSSLPVCVNPGSGLNCYWEMPFRSSCRITLTNLNGKAMYLYYQVNYTLTDVPDDAAYFHARHQRSEPVAEGQVHTILDGITGSGHYVGTYMTWRAATEGWWGEGEVKFYIDGDGEFPTICGTGTEDYFGGSYCFTVKDADGRNAYREYATPYCGFQVGEPGKVFAADTRFGMYRWHITDPVRFASDLRVTVQSLGWTDDRRYRLRWDDVTSVAFWYQAEG
jgi:D-arabinan exo alpha-(1,3)/(1,5)-arabinofuranosidase (non-reducing end)